MTDAAVEEIVASQELIDHHCHSILPGTLTVSEFEDLLTEAPSSAAAVTSTFDTSAGLALLKHVGDLLGLPAGRTPGDLVAARNSLDAVERVRGLVGGNGVSELFVDGGFNAAHLLDSPSLGAMSGIPVRPIVRLEAVAQDVLVDLSSPHEFADRLRDELRSRTADAVGLKSVAAYRSSLEIPGTAPTSMEVERAVAAELDDRSDDTICHLRDPVIIAYVLHMALEVTDLPIQFHVGYGDPDLRLDKASPLLLTDFIRTCLERSRNLMLLHCYPFHRQAAYLASVYPNVYLDLGLALNFVGHLSHRILSETLELAPYAKMLYSSDAYGLPELHYMGALNYRAALTSFLCGLTEGGYGDLPVLARIARLIGRENALRAYSL